MAKSESTKVSSKQLFRIVSNEILKSHLGETLVDSPLAM